MPHPPRSAKEYADAIEHYTLSLGFQPSTPALHANRAAAYLKVRQGACMHPTEQGCRAIISTLLAGDPATVACMPVFYRCTRSSLPSAAMAGL